MVTMKRTMLSMLTCMCEWTVKEDRGGSNVKANTWPRDSALWKFIEHR